MKKERRDDTMNAHRDAFPLTRIHTWRMHTWNEGELAIIFPFCILRLFLDAMHRCEQTHFAADIANHRRMPFNWNDCKLQLSRYYKRENIMMWIHVLFILLLSLFCVVGEGNTGININHFIDFFKLYFEGEKKWKVKTQNEYKHTMVIFLIIIYLNKFSRFNHPHPPENVYRRKSLKIREGSKIQEMTSKCFIISKYQKICIKREIQISLLKINITASHP